MGDVVGSDLVEGNQLDSQTPDTRTPDTRTVELLRLLGTHERGLFAYVYALTPSWQDAEEVMQQVRIRIWQDFDRYDPEKPFGSWARAIAYYQTLTYRKQKSRQREFFSEAILREVSDTYEKMADASTDRRTALLGCLDKLSDRKRHIIESYYQSPEPNANLAESLSMTQNALRQLLFRIRKILFQCIERSLRSEMQS
jgi:RNA polymerase sigma-70 factor, ECF subfamily